jgi:hypothetical protein
VLQHAIMEQTRQQTLFTAGVSPRAGSEEIRVRAIAAAVLGDATAVFVAIAVQPWRTPQCDSEYQKSNCSAPRTKGARFPCA